MKRVLTIVLAFAMCFSLVACVSKPEAPIREIQKAAILPEEQAGDINHINNISQSGNDDFTRSFVCETIGGDQLAVYIQNNSADSIYANIIWENESNKEAYPAVTIGTNGENCLQIFSNAKNNHTGISGKWTINITPVAGGPLDVSVTARQYSSQMNFKRR